MRPLLFFARFLRFCFAVSCCLVGFAFLNFGFGRKRLALKELSVDRNFGSYQMIRRILFPGILALPE